jgi:putative effector of murein hydrolase
VNLYPRARDQARKSEKQGTVMPNSGAAVMLAATVATVFTIFSAPAAQIAASPLPQSVTAPVAFCAERPWPYYGCVGTGNAQVRLVSSGRFAD